MEVSKIVPQFFYDVIARGVPGGALIAATSFSLGDKASIQDIVMYGFDGKIEDVSPTISFLILLAFYSYALGHLIAPIGDRISKLKIVDDHFKSELHVLRHAIDPKKSKFPKRVREYLEKEVGISKNGILNEDESKVVEYTSVLFIWSDWLRLKSADAGARIVKLRAEYRLFIGLCVVGLYSAFFHILSYLYLMYIEKPISFNIVLVLGGLVASCLGLYGYCKAYSVFQYSVINNYYAGRGIEGDIDPE